MQSEFLKYSLNSNDNHLDELIKEIIPLLNSFRETKKKVNSAYLDKDKYILRRILNALYQSYYSIPKTKVALSLTAQHYSGTEFSYRSIKRIYHCLITNRYILYYKGSKLTSKITRIYPSTKLIIIFKKIGFIWRKYEFNPNDNILLVKIKDKETKKKKIVTTPDNYKSIKLQSNLDYINNNLSKHCLTLDIDDDAYLLLENEIKKHNRKYKHSDYWKENIPYSINYSNFKLRRIFSNKELTLHGRFYGGWWQSLPERFRQHITIDGRQTVEVDYSTLALRMVYALEKKEITSPGDAFDLGLKPNKEQRKIIKKFTYAIINDEEGRYRLSDENYKLLKVSHKELIGLILKYHPPVKKYLRSNIGLKLMNYDSKITQDILLNMFKKDIIVLPIHDSFIVARKYLSVLTKQMEVSYNKVLNQLPKYDISEPKWRLDFYESLDKRLKKTDKLSKENFSIMSGKKSSIYYNYLFSWKNWLNQS